MSETPPEFDLKFLPDWLKAGPSENRYANYEGESDRGRRGDRDDRRGPGNRPGGDRRGPRPGGPGGDRRGPRPGGPGGPQGQRREGGPGPRREGGPGGQRRPDQRRDDRRGPYDRNRPPQPQFTPANVRIEFLPEPTGAQSIARQVKSSSRAYPLFSTGRLFLERPERHRVRITALDKDATLSQIGDGPIAFDRTLLERNAFRDLKAQYYKEETTQGEPLKGNFSNVARSRTAGILLGPTNHHGYQPALRKLYEERFSRRMSFSEFVQNEIQVVSDEQTINDWKEQARSTTTFTTTQEAEPITFKSAFEAEQHFRKTYLPTIVKSGTTLECPGVASRAMPERNMGAALRDAWEKERGFPAQLVNNLRPYLLEAGLHFFKHRKRVLYISAIKPVRIAPGQDLSGNLAAIIAAIEGQPKLTRRDLALKILGEHHEAPEMLEQKAQLARDLHYLVHAGHVIEFHDGTLDMPLPPGGQQPQQGQQAKGGKPQPQAAGAAAIAAATPAEDLEPEPQAEEIVASPTESHSTEELQAATESPTSEPAVLTTSVPEVEPLSGSVEMADLPPALQGSGEFDQPAASVAAAPVEPLAESSADSLSGTSETAVLDEVPATDTLVGEAEPAIEPQPVEVTVAPAEVNALQATESLQSPEQ